MTEIRRAITRKEVLNNYYKKRVQRLNELKAGNDQLRHIKSEQNG